MKKVLAVLVAAVSMFLQVPDSAEAFPVVTPQVQPSYDPTLQARIDARVADILARYGGSASIAIDDGRYVYYSGNIASGPVMSTIKVPIALATEQAGVAIPADAKAAITWSDNDATDRMYSRLGEDADTLIASVITERSPKPSINQGQRWAANQWSVTGQATFGRNLECVDPDRSVIAEMGNVVAEQRYGLGRIPVAHFKGGWSPIGDGRYLVRQFGMIPTAQGRAGVAIMAYPADGTYASAQLVLNDLADEISMAIGMGLGSPLHC